MVDVTTSIEINSPVKKVAAYAMNPNHAPEWYVNIKSVEWKTAKPLTTGSRIAFVAHFLGKKLSYIYEVVELSDTTMIMRTADGPFLMETTYHFERVGDNRTKMTLRNRGMPSGFLKVVAPFMAVMMRKANNKDLRSIKRIVEGLP